jgi:hypothetical protein
MHALPFHNSRQNFLKQKLDDVRVCLHLMRFEPLADVLDHPDTVGNVLRNFKAEANTFVEITVVSPKQGIGGLR